MNRRNVWIHVTLLAGVAGLMGCGSPVQFLAQGQTYRARPADAPVDVLEGPLHRPYAVVGTLRLAHRVRPGYGEASSLDRAMEHILTEARRVGADAVVDVRREATPDAEAGETFFVSAKAVRYLQRAEVVRNGNGS